MQDVGGPYQQLLEGHLDPKAPAITYYSTVRGIFMTDQDEFGPSYWVANLASPVLFHSGVKALLSLPQLQGSPHVEIGPHSALAGPLKQIYKEVDIKPQYLSLLTRNEDARKSILEAAGKLFCAGVDLNFAAINPKGITLPKLPNYPWHREGGFWHESRVTKSWRLKPFAHHDILGSRVAEASDLEPVWRNLMHPNTMPAWIRDYVIRSETIFPTAAYIAMVGEAVSQISGNRDYTVRNVTINIASPLVVRGNESLELITSLRPYKLTTTAESAWFDFSIISNSSTGWINICHGQVRSGAASEYITSEPPPLLRRISSRRWYKAWRRLGLEYGPSFHGLQDIVVGVDQKVASATVVEGLTESEPSYQLHPTSLTMVIQAIDAAMYHGQTRAIHTAFQPKYIEELYVGAGAGKQIHINIVARTSPGNVVTGYGYGVNQSNKLAVFFEGVTLSALDVEGDNRGDNPHGAVQLEWKPDIDLIDLGALARPKILMESAVTMIEKLFLLCAIENQAQIQGHIAVGGHLNKFCNWLQELIESARENKSRVVSATSKLCELSSSERQEMIQEMMDQARDTPTMAAYRPIYAIYEAAVDIIAGEVDALELLFRDDMLTDFYNFFTWIDFVDLVQLLGHENPKLRVLEIGAGTGSYTEIFLKSLKNSAGKRLYSKYFYTDISAGFFVKAKERFIDYPGIEYRTFDVTKAPGEQGLEEDTFDVVVAGNVSYAGLCYLSAVLLTESRFYTLRRFSKTH
jgi:acyl transferase domain-containing protein